MNRRPGWLTAIATIAIVFGMLGILNSMVGAMWQYFSSSMGEMIQQWIAASQSNRNVPPEAKAMQEEMFTLMQNLQARWWTVLILLFACNVAVSTLLVAGGVGTLRLTEWGRRLLIFALAATIVFELSNVAAQMIIQHESRGAARNYMSKVMEASVPPANQAIPPAQQDAMNRIMGVSTDIMFVVSIAMTLTWALVKIIAYGLAIYYLHRPQIRALVANQAGPAEVQAVATES